MLYKAFIVICLFLAVGVFSYSLIDASSGGAFRTAPGVQALAVAPSSSSGKRYYDRLPIEDENGVHQPGSLILTANRDGHFYADAEVNGLPTKMLIDTGATISSISAKTARSAGIDTSALSYSQAVQTANGTIYAARATLARLRVGGIEVSNLEILISKPNETGLNDLLGMNFVKRMTTFNINGRTLTMVLGNPPIYRKRQSGS